MERAISVWSDWNIRDQPSRGSLLTGLITSLDRTEMSFTFGKIDGLRHVPIAHENSPKSAQNIAQKRSNSARIFEKGFKFSNSARTLLVVFNNFLADVHKYS